MGRKQKYLTEEERKAAHREAKKRYYQRHKEDIIKKNTKYYRNNKEDVLAKASEYRSTPFGRANILKRGYMREDKKYGRGECTLTADWIVENIFSQPCHYCGRTDWTKMGCDRIDNSLPHTPDNVVPCCGECNTKKMHKPYDDFMKMIGKIV